VVERLDVLERVVAVDLHGDALPGRAELREAAEAVEVLERRVVADADAVLELAADVRERVELDELLVVGDEHGAGGAHAVEALDEPELRVGVDADGLDVALDAAEALNVLQLLVALDDERAVDLRDGRELAQVLDVEVDDKQAALDRRALVVRVEVGDRAAVAALERADRGERHGQRRRLGGRRDGGELERLHLKQVHGRRVDLRGRLLQVPRQRAGRVHDHVSDGREVVGVALGDHALLVEGVHLQDELLELLAGERAGHLSRRALVDNARGGAAGARRLRGSLYLPCDLPSR
jgi:hypothetical protein